MLLKLNLIRMFEYGWMDGKFIDLFHRDIVRKIYFSYDMVHFGHANACRQAKQMGGYLIVGVHSDGLLKSFAHFETIRVLNVFRGNYEA